MDTENLAETPLFAATKTEHEHHEWAGPTVAKLSIWQRVKVWRHSRKLRKAGAR